MSGPVQLIPRGLLGFLQLKNSGRNPTDMPEVLQPVLPLQDWYWQTNTEIVNATNFVITSASVPNFTNRILVPDDEYWVLHDLSVTLQLAAASTISFTPFYRNALTAVNASAMPLSERVDWVQATHGTNVLVNMTRNRPLIIPSGGALGLYVGFLSADTTSGDMIARITRLPA